MASDVTLAGAIPTHAIQIPFAANTLNALGGTTIAETRMRDGIPVGPGLMAQVRQIAQAAAAPWLLD